MSRVIKFEPLKDYEMELLDIPNLDIHNVIGFENTQAVLIRHFKNYFKTNKLQHKFILLNLVITLSVIK